MEESVLTQRKPMASLEGITLELLLEAWQAEQEEVQPDEITK